MYGIIYKATNKINGKSYIGQTTKPLEKRKLQHLKKGSYFHNALKKYSFDNFTWKILENCHSKNELNEMEFHYIKQYNTFADGYNLTYGGEDNPMNYQKLRKKISKKLEGHVVSKETRQKISKTLDKKKIVYCDACGNKLLRAPAQIHSTNFCNNTCSHAGKNNPMYDKHHTKESKDKIGNANKGKLKGENHPLYQKHRSEKTKNKIRLSILNNLKKRCPYCNKIVDVSNYGRWHGDKCKER
jgi:group I intron endonuclease